MMNFKNVEVVKKANIYSDGKVTSRTVITEEGEKKTLGVMLPGMYSFNAQAPEKIDIMQGSCNVRLNGAGIWNEYKAGQSFKVPANTKFEIEVQELLDYICNYG
ncbi:MAG: pyrimidine/purine nucleoside phosphorylase [Gammaproteobacteria bacterium]